MQLAGRGAYMRFIQKLRNQDPQCDLPRDAGSVEDAP